MLPPNENFRLKVKSLSGTHRLLCEGLPGEVEAVHVGGHGYTPVHSVVINHALTHVMKEGLGEITRENESLKNLVSQEDKRLREEALWDVLRIYGVGGRLLDGVKAFYRDASACVTVKGEMG